MKSLVIFTSLIVYAVSIADWYTREDYKILKRSVSWIPFTPQEHPLKLLTSDQIKRIILGHKHDPIDLKSNILSEDSNILNIPSFLLGPPNEFYVDQAFPKCVKDSFSYGSCTRSDIWAITRTLSWSDCARNMRNVTYSSKMFLLTKL